MASDDTATSAAVATAATAIKATAVATTVYIRGNSSRRRRKRWTGVHAVITCRHIKLILLNINTDKSH